MSIRTEEFFQKIDGPLLAQQRLLLLDLRNSAADLDLMLDAELELLDGMITLTDNLADIAYDEYGKQCLLQENTE